MQMIGIAGRARVGKDTAARFLEDFYGFACFAFAGPIKRALEQWTGAAPNWLHGADKDCFLPGLDKTPRQLMQSLGAWGRAQHPDFWISALEREIEAARRSGDFGYTVPPGIVVTDVRTEREAAWVRRGGGITERGHILHLTRVGAPIVSADETERNLARDPADVHITNDETIQALHRRVEQALAHFDRLGAQEGER